MNLKIKKLRWVTSCIKHLAISGLSSVLARIKSSCNLIANRFEMPIVSYTQPLAASVKRPCNPDSNGQTNKRSVNHFDR